MRRLERSSLWSVDDSLRQADLAHLALAAGEPVLRVGLGAGRADTIMIVHPIGSASDITNVRLQCLTRVHEDAKLAIGVTLTTDRERPWLEVEPQPITGGGWFQLDFDLSEFATNKLANVDRLNLSFVTDADDGYMLIRDLVVGPKAA